MIFRISILFVLLLDVAVGFGQNQVRWISFEEAVKKSEKDPRKILIDVYTDWCGWCKKMDTNTFSNNDIAKYLNENYYSVKFDAEQKESIRFNGVEYKYVKTFKGGYHEFATFILDGQLSFPSVVFINENNDIIQAIPGYQDVKSMDMIIHFFGGNHHLNTPWRKFEKIYQMEKEMAIPVKGN